MQFTIYALFFRSLKKYSETNNKYGEKRVLKFETMQRHNKLVLQTSARVGYYIQRISPYKTDGQITLAAALKITAVTILLRR